MADKFNGVAVVTGGGSGIGKGIGIALAAHGASVAIADVSGDDAQEVARQIVAAGGQAIGIACDVSDRASVASLHAETSRRLGPASIVLANAGVVTFERLVDMSDRDLDWILGVNLFGVLHCLRAFLPDMIEQGRGHVLATASQAALLPSSGPFRTAYVTAKSGVLGLMLAMRHELAESGVGSTVICPGRVETQIAGSQRHRPARFGGAGHAQVPLPPLPPALAMGAAMPVEHLAQMVIGAIRENRAVVVTDPASQDMYVRESVEPVRAAFAAAAAFVADETRQ